MTKIVVYHPDNHLRADLVRTLRNAGHVAYDAADPDRAWAAVQVLQPDVLITSFPARLDLRSRTGRTLTEAVRLSDEFGSLPVLNVTSFDEPDAGAAVASGVTRTLAASAPASDLLNALLDIARPSAPARASPVPGG